MIRRCPIVPLLLLALLVPSLSAQAPLRIGTWNLEFFGDPANHRDKLPPRSAQDIAAIGEMIRELSVSALAVQEICGAAALQQVAEAIGPGWEFVLGTTGGWDDGKTAQNIGFLYDAARVELLWAEELLDFPRERDGLPIFHRVPVTACFRDRQTGCDFRAVTVHLKASTKPDDLRKRKSEATVLRDWLLLLQNGTGEDQDIVVLGDFNSTYGTDPELVLGEAGVVRYLRPAAPTPTIMHFPEPIDQIAPSPRFTEVRADSFAVHGPAPGVDKQGWRKSYSDHFAVTVELRASGDDDPEASFSRANSAWVLPLARRPAAAAPVATPPRRAGKAADDAAAPERGDDPFPVGEQVEVFTAQLTVRGTLVRPLGTWVYLRDGDGRLNAIPREQVLRVRSMGR